MIDILPGALPEHDESAGDGMTVILADSQISRRGFGVIQVRATAMRRSNQPALLRSANLGNGLHDIDQVNKPYRAAGRRPNDQAMKRSAAPGRQKVEHAVLPPHAVLAHVLEP